LTPHRSTAVSGTVVTDDRTPLPFPAARIRIDPVVADPESVFPAWSAPRPTSPKADGTFRLTNVDGQYLFRISGQPDDWALKRVMLADRDITDTPIPIAGGSPDLTGLQIVLTHKGAKITGDVVDASGVAAPDATVIVFAEQSSQWGLASRYVKVARPDNAGKFSIAGLLPGAYRMVAREGVADGQWEDTGFLQALMKDAARVELAEGATETIKLTVGVAR
jgi:hypothetical protein